MTVLTTLMSGDHRHCDALFAEAEQAVARADWSAAKQACAAFSTALAQHLDAEEAQLFPAFEAAVGSSMGPTRVMRYEHQEIRALTGELAQAALAADTEAYRGVAETLLIMMQQHNLKEENILYPMCDQQLQGEAASLAASLEVSLNRGAS